MAPFPANYLKQNCKLRNVIGKWQRELTKIAKHNRSNRPAPIRGEKTKTTGTLKNTPKRCQHRLSLEKNSNYGKAFSTQKLRSQNNKNAKEQRRKPQKSNRNQKAKHAMNAGQ